MSRKLATDFSSALIDKDYDLNLKLLLKQKSISNLIARLNTISRDANIYDDPSSKELFNFLEGKINSKNKKEYVSMKYHIEAELVKQLAIKPSYKRHFIGKTIPTVFWKDNSKSFSLCYRHCRKVEWDVPDILQRFDRDNLDYIRHFSRKKWLKETYCRHFTDILQERNDIFRHKKTYYRHFQLTCHENLLKFRQNRIWICRNRHFAPDFRQNPTSVSNFFIFD